jgi:quinoprotein glucose dehydrogenase
VFHGATADDFATHTGESLWQAELPAGGKATASTCMGSEGKQYVVISAAGHGVLGTALGDSVTALRLD